jgi:acetyl esterase
MAVKPFVDSHMARLLEQIRANAAPDYRAMPIAEARRVYEQLALSGNHRPDTAVEATEVTIPGPVLPIRSRLYSTSAGGRTPLVIYIHGGGWTFGSIDTHDGLTRHLAAATGCAVLGIDYRLAPEHPFPAGLDDVLAAIKYAWDGRLGDRIDSRRIALAGDSAGANLALAALIALKERGKARVATATLLYGNYAPVFDTDSHRHFGEGNFRLSSAMVRWYWRNYLGTEPEDTLTLAAPLHADLSGLPPLYLNAAGLDPLLDETYLLSQRLTDFGVGHRIDMFPGVVHGFLRMTRDLPAGRIGLRAAAAFLREMLGVDQP